MTINISAFRAVASDTGYVKASNDNNGVTRFGTGFLGKITAWFRGNDAEANKAIKADFLLALKSTYGESFSVDNKSFHVLIGEDQLSMTDAKPLSARVVRDILAMGDSVLEAKSKQVDLKLSHGGNSIEVRSAYKNPEAMQKAARLFREQAQFDAKGSTLVANILAYINRPDEAKLNQLAQGPGGDGVSKFAQAFKIGENDMKVLGAAQSKELQTHCDKIGVNPTDIANAASSIMQLPTRFKLLCDSLATSRDDKQFGLVAKEILNTTKLQVDSLEHGIKALSHPNIFDGIPAEDVLHLASLKEGLESRLGELKNPDGPYQRFIALAAEVAVNPNRDSIKLALLMPG